LGCRFNGHHIPDKDIVTRRAGGGKKLTLCLGVNVADLCNLLQAPSQFEGDFRVKSTGFGEDNREFSGVSSS
jgi:hypothetical protein